MQDEPIQQGTVRIPPMGGTARLPGEPSSSRMFASYLNDVEQLLDAHRGEAALREAVDLPRIAVALADPQLHCSVEKVQGWCEQWIRPPGAERDANGLASERLARGLSERVLQMTNPGGVPMRALRRLQLRRHVRTPPRGFPRARATSLSEREQELFETCTALLEAARRWYARMACHDVTVQDNLARLAVLR
ncbi:MAG TPA: hypothetical protein VK803_09800 [Steroidobacteraceae bacterium]|jgi:hypothetical protein|nr:hypothetical protein [Steroidobacteraceae bacterium]